MADPPSQGEELVSEVLALQFERKPRGCVSREDVFAPPLTLGLDDEFDEDDPTMLSDDGEDYFETLDKPVELPGSSQPLSHLSKPFVSSAPVSAASAHPPARPARSTRPAAHASVPASVPVPAFAWASEPGTAPQCPWVEVRLVATAEGSLVEFVFTEEVPVESAEEVQRRTDRRNRMLGIKSAQPPAEAAPASTTPRHRRGAGRISPAKAESSPPKTGRTSPTKAERISTTGRISPPKAGRISPTKAERTSTTGRISPPKATLSPPPQIRKPLASSPLTAESTHSPPAPLLPYSPPLPLLLTAPRRPNDSSARPGVNSVMGRLTRGYSSVALRRGGLPEDVSDAAPSPPSTSLTSRLVESRSKLRLPLQLHDWEQRLWRPVLSSTGEQRQNRRLARRDGSALTRLAVPVLAREMQGDAVRSSPRRAPAQPAVSSRETEAERQREAQWAAWAQERDRLQRVEWEQAQQRASEASEHALLQQRESAASFWKTRVRPGRAPARPTAPPTLSLGGWLPRHRSASRDSYSEPPPCYVGRSSSRACHISLLCHISPFVQNRSLPAEFYEEVDCTVVNPSPPKRRSKKKITSSSPRARRLEPSEDLDTAALAKAAEGSAIAAENRDNGEGTAAC